MSPPFNVRQAFGPRVGHTMRQWRCAVDVRLRPFGLTEATWLPLAYLARGTGPMRHKELADAVGIESSTLVRLVDALVNAGLVQRQTDGDRRARLLSLTPSGHALAERMFAVTAEIRQQVLAGISDAELQGVLGVIDRIAAAVERLRATDAPEAADE